MSEQLDRFSLILGPGEKIEEPEAPKTPKTKKRRGRPKKTKGRSTKGKSKNTRPTGKVPSGRRRYEIRNLSTMDVVLRFSGGAPIIIGKNDTLYADLFPGDLQNNSVQQMVLNANISIKELSPPAEGSVVYLQPDGSCSTTPPKPGETAVVMGYIAPTGSEMSDGYVTMDTNVDGFDTDVLVEGTISDQKMVVSVGGGEVMMFDASNGEMLDPYGGVGSTPYGVPREKTDEEEFAEALGLDEY